MAEPNVEIVALQTQVAELRLKLSELEQSKVVSSSSPSVSRVKVIEISAASDTAGIPKFEQLGDVKHDIKNPIRREAHWPVDPQLVDLKGSRGYEAVAQGGVPSMVFEYHHHASYNSFNFDYIEALRQLIPAVSDDGLRKSFCVVLTGLCEVQSKITNRLDFLKVYGEKRFSEPGLVTAVEQAIVGTADLPVSSSDVLGAVASYRSQVQRVAIKQGAIQDYSHPWQGRGRGRGQPGRQFRQQQQQQQAPGRDPYPLRNRQQQQQQQQQGGNH